MREESEDFMEWCKKMSEKLDEKIAQEMFSSMDNIYTTATVNKEFKKGDIVFIDDMANDSELKGETFTLGEACNKLNELERDNTYLTKQRNSLRTENYGLREKNRVLISRVEQLRYELNLMRQTNQDLRSQISNQNNLKDFSRNQSKVINMVIDSLRYSGSTEGEINNILSILSKGK